MVGVRNWIILIKLYVFPKSRRLDVDGDVLGFVKLSIN